MHFYIVCSWVGEVTGGPITNYPNPLFPNNT